MKRKRKKKRNFSYASKGADYIPYFFLKVQRRSSTIKEVYKEVKERTSVDEEMVEILSYHFRDKCFNSSQSSTVECGWLNKESFEEMCVESYGFDSFLISNLFRIFDLDNNGVIDFSEFMIGMCIFFEGNNDEVMALMFKFFDIERNNLITKEELKHVLDEVLQYSYGIMSPKRMEKILAKVMKELKFKSGRVEFDEFRENFRNCSRIVEACEFLLYKY